MDDLDALLATRAQQVQPDPLDAMLASRAAGGQIALGKPVPKQGSGNSWIDGGNAVGTGYLRGLVGLAGLPVDTVANVIDLGKAALGSGYQAISGRAAPDALQVGDRSDVVGSGAYLQKKVGASRLGDFLTNPANSDYEGGYLQNAGAALGGVANPNSKAELAKQILLSETGATAAKVVKDNGGSNAAAVTAMLLPQGASYYGAEGVKRMVRGGEQGRQQMAARIQDLENAGVSNPTLGLASGNQTVGGVENLLQNTPGAIGVMRNARSQAIDALQSKVSESAALASPNRGSLAAGTSIQKGIQDFKDSFKANQEQLYGKMDNSIPLQTPTSVSNTRTALANLNADIPGAPEMSKFFKNSKIQGIQAALESDTGNAQPTTLQAALGRNPLYDASGQPSRTVVPPSDKLPWEAVKKTRTMVGKELADNTPFSDVPRSKWDPLYAALSQDMGVAANAAGPDATRAFNRATDYTRAGIGRLDRVAPFANLVAPEQAYTAMVNASKENVSTLQAVKKTLPQDARGTVAGTVIERLGKATNGVQNESGTVWSPETFLTNWNKMAPRARSELFSGFSNSAEVSANVEAVAKAASMMRDNSKMWANPSGTGANLAARATLGAPFIPLLQGMAPNPYVLGGVAATTAGANALARALTSRDVVNSVANPTRLSQNDVSTLLRAMQATGNLSK